MKTSEHYIYYYLIGDYSKIKEFVNLYIGKEYKDKSHCLIFNNCLHYVHGALNYALFGNEKDNYILTNIIVPSIYNPFHVFGFTLIIPRYLENYRIFKGAGSDGTYSYLLDNALDRLLSRYYLR